MRFFGYVLQEWLADEDVEDDGSFERGIAQMRAAVSDYQRHIDALPSFPEELRRIAHPFVVDDALFVRALYEPAKARMKLTLRCGNWREEYMQATAGLDSYFDLILRYDGVAISPHDLAELARAVPGAKTARGHWHDAFCHELDLLPDGRIEHGFLFHGSWDWIATDQFERVLPVMFTIRCTALTWERIERPDRKLPRLKDRFRVV